MQIKSTKRLHKLRNRSHFSRDAKRIYEKTYYSYASSVVSTVTLLVRRTPTLIDKSIWFSQETRLNLLFMIFLNVMCCTETTLCFSWYYIRDIAAGLNIKSTGIRGMRLPNEPGKGETVRGLSRCLQQPMSSILRPYMYRDIPNIVPTET
ncbi:hypothetical protein CSKR_108166 [Clonorchis sinensis]|uniref:Uncharacterized protein n=1 Tax=Clonorchis sinensis TaxID=79923 RepID=A0A3R7EX03_CLOSI|nr:hypothetical protein CSKR_108166 [Clonorchis sinensis]